MTDATEKNDAQVPADNQHSTHAPATAVDLIAVTTACKAILDGLSCDQIRAELRSRYKNDQPEWPMQQGRVEAIYNSMARAVLNSSKGDKDALFAQLLGIAADFERNWTALTASDSSFDAWFNCQIGRLQAMQFGWTDRGNKSHNNITFGIAQKFINLMLKDWWCLKSNQLGANYAVLHAPFDNLVRGELWRLTRISFPSLSERGVYVLDQTDYDTYQKHLVSPELAAALRIPCTFQRIEVEQILWMCGIIRDSSKLFLVCV